MIAKKIIIVMCLCVTTFLMYACDVDSGVDEALDKQSASDNEALKDDKLIEANNVVDSAVSFEHTLDDYVPKKKEYNFYFTYKIVHPWWDAVAMGLEDAADQYAEKGVIINYEYLAPQAVDAEDQRKRLLEAGDRGFDVIGVDVADSAEVAPVINHQRMLDKMKLIYPNAIN